MKIEIRKETKEDYKKTEAMVRRSFYNKFRPGCDEHLMVHTLRDKPYFLEEFSRVAVVDGEIAGTIMYFMAKVAAGDKVYEVPSFGPLCVDHKYKNHKIGTRLLEETLPLVKEAGYPGVIIVGEPDYYPKLGFVRAGSLGLTDENGNVYDAFMALEFTQGALTIPGGRFIEPEDICNFSEEEIEAFDKQFELLLTAIRPCQWSYPNATEEKEGYHLEYAMKYPKQFNRLFEAYVEELSEYDEGLKDDRSSELTAKIWESVSNAAYLIFVGEEVAGLLVTSVPEEEISDTEYTSYLQELYVCPNFRRRGIGRDIFLRFIKNQKRDTGFCMIPESQSGRYWKKLLDEAGYRYDSYKEDEAKVFCHVHIEGRSR